METALLASGIPVLYFLMMLVTTRIIARRSMEKLFKDQDSYCWSSCKISCPHRKPSRGWDSPHHALTKGVHPSDWFLFWLASFGWPVLAPAFLAYKPIRAYLLKPPREKLTLEEKLQRAEAELEAARKAQDKAQE